MSISLKPATVIPGDGRRGPSIRFIEEAQFLKDHANEWFEVRTMKDAAGAYTATSCIRAGRTRAFVPAGHFQAKALGTIVIARYVGKSK